MEQWLRHGVVPANLGSTPTGTHTSQWCWQERHPAKIAPMHQQKSHLCRYIRALEQGSQRYWMDVLHYALHQSAALLSISTAELNLLWQQRHKWLYRSSKTVFPLVLWHCWFGDRKGIRPVKSCILVCRWWRFDWSFASLIAPVVTTITSNNLRPH